MPDGSKFGKVDITGKVYPKEFSPEEAKNWKSDSPMTDLGIKEYIALAFKHACENKEQVNDLFSRAELD